MAEHRRPYSSGQDSAVCLHLKTGDRFFSYKDVHILDTEERMVWVGSQGGHLCENPKTTSSNAVIATISQLFVCSAAHGSFEF